MVTHMDNITWEVKSKGTLERIVIVFVTLSVIGFLFLLRSGFLISEHYDGFADESWIPVLVFFFVVGIPTIAVVLPRIFGSKTPGKIKLDVKHETLTLYYGGDRQKSQSFASLAFSFVEKRSHNYLVLYKTFVGSRDQQVINPIASMIGMGSITSSWKRGQLRMIRDALSQAQIQRVDADNNNLPLWEKFLS